MSPARRQRPWYLVPMILLGIGIIASGFVLVKLLNRHPASNANSNTDQTTNNRNVDDQAYCGDGICQNFACTALSCPTPETPESCPEDCDSDISTSNQNNNASTNVNAGSLTYVLATQTLTEKSQCPVEESNLTPADAVNLAKSSGLTQGTKSLELRLYRSAEPLDQCVWSVKNFESTNGGRTVIIIDATQEVLQTSTWSNSPAQ